MEEILRVLGEELAARQRRIDTLVGDIDDMRWEVSDLRRQLREQRMLHEEVATGEALLFVEEEPFA